MDVEVIVKIGQYTGAGVCMGLGAIGAAMGEGLTGGWANRSISRRSEMAPSFTRNMLVAQAVAETSAIFALMVTVLLIFVDLSGNGICAWAAALGAGLSMGFGAFGSGIGAGYSGSEAIWGTSRQPAIGGQMTTTMLVGQAVCQTPAIFALVIAFLLMFKDYSGIPAWPYSAALLGAGLSMGLGAIGSGWGGGETGGAACKSFARHPRTSADMMTLMLVGQAVGQTPAIFALLVSFMLIFGDYTGSITLSGIVAPLAAGICMGLGALGPGYGNGLTSARACEALTMQPDKSGLIMRTMLVGQAVAQSTSIYALVIAFVLMFVV